MADQARPLVGPSITQNSGPGDSKIRSAVHPARTDQAQGIHPHLATPIALSVPDQHTSAALVQIRLDKRERLMDTQAGAPQDNDQAPHPSAVTTVSGLAHDRFTEVAGNTPGKGLPQSEQDRHAGTQSGFVTTLATGASDLFIPVPAGGELKQHESTYNLKAVPGTPPPGFTGKEGQIITRGVFLYKNETTVGPKTLAITGGTGAYANARGQITEKGSRHELEIVLLP